MEAYCLKCREKREFEGNEVAASVGDGRGPFLAVACEEEDFVAWLDAEDGKEAVGVGAAEGEASRAEAARVVEAGDVGHGPSVPQRPVRIPLALVGRRYRVCRGAACWGRHRGRG